MGLHLLHRSAVPWRAGATLFLFVLLLASVLATAGCGSLQVEAHLLQPTAAATSVPTASPTAAVPAFPAASPETQIEAPPGGQTAPVPAGGTAGQGLASAPPTVTPPATSTTDVKAAVQTVLDYFYAINQRDYARAYGIWERRGAASGQTFEEFAQGYADTGQVSVLLGTPSLQGTGARRQVVVPVTLISIANLPDYTQSVQRYQGTYILRPAEASGASGWEIAVAGVAEGAAAPLPPVDVADPTTLLRSYFDAINRREFARAYSYWNHLGQSSQQSFAQFEQGFATTKQVKVDLGTPQENAGAGNVWADVPVTIVATQDDGSTRVDTATYTAHRANIPPFDQLGWRIEGAKVTGTGSAETRRLPSATGTP